MTGARQQPRGPAAVAVVIPAFNSADYLDQALASVAGQTVAPTTAAAIACNSYALAIDGEATLRRETRRMPPSAAKPELST